MKLSPMILRYGANVGDYCSDRTWAFAEMADFASDQVRDPNDRLRLIAELEELQSSGLPDDQLNQLWTTTNARTWFKEDGTRKFIGEWITSLKRGTRRYTL